MIPIIHSVQYIFAIYGPPGSRVVNSKIPYTSLRCWPGSPIIRSLTWLNSCRGIGAPGDACRRRCLKWRRRPSHSPSAAPPKSSGEDEQLLWELADEMHPENGCL